MDLFETQGNVIPPNAIVVPVRTRDGLTLRVARWMTPNAKGTVLIGMGRSEFIEQYAEIVAALLKRDLGVVVLDWRGQGLSDREIRKERRGHVSSFKAYRYDLEAVEQQVLKPFATKPWFGLGHSMGGAILLDQAHDGSSPFERLVLSAPMIGLSLRHKKAVRRLVRLAVWFGLGRQLIPRGTENSLFLTRPFADNILTSDRRQYERLKTATTDLPRLAIGAPTFGWLNSAFELMRRFDDPRFPIETLTPILVIAAGDDRIVDTPSTERLAINLKAGRCITIPHARHQVIMENPVIDAQFWAAFDAFIPGQVATAAAPTPRRRARLVRIADWLRTRTKRRTPAGDLVS